MAKLGGAPGRPDREERLEKLLASCAYGGAAVPDAPRSKQPKERPKERQKPPMAAHRAKSSGAVSSLPSCSGSRLLQTTEAYRQQRGTTARSLTEVGYSSMTPEKAAEVDRARAKALPAKASRARSSTPSQSSRSQRFLGKGQALSGPELRR
ncbi:unnamed protein product [Effrenium voratum]|nr:unnamed protein product [Effrenium voratum]CAJ1460855.1 unnamed protein product [Effrenium voratum]